MAPFVDLKKKNNNKKVNLAWRDVPNRELLNRRVPVWRTKLWSLESPQEKSRTARIGFCFYFFYAKLTLDT